MSTETDDYDSCMGRCSVLPGASDRPCPACPAPFDDDWQPIPRSPRRAVLTVNLPDVPVAVSGAGASADEEEQ